MAQRQMVYNTGPYLLRDFERRELEFTMEVLKSYRNTFIEDVDACSICDDLRHHNIIPDSLAKKLNESDDRQAATMLYNHVVKQGSKESVANLCEVMITEKGYPRMNELGGKIKESLQSCNFTSDMSMNPSGRSMALQPKTNLLSMHEGMQQEEPSPIPLTPYSALAPSTSFSMSHLSLPQGASCQRFPSVPKYYPLEEKLKDKFGKLVGALAEAVRNISPNKFSALKRILCQHLRPLRTSQPPELPDDSEELLKYLDDKWDFLNIRIVQVIVESLPKRRLKNKLESYERYLSSKLKEFLFKCQKEGIKPKQRPFGCYVMVEVQASPEEIMLGDILKLRDFLEHSLRIRPVYFDGLADGSIVVFLSIPDECVYTLGTLLPSYIPVLQSWKISCVVAQGYFALDVQECIFTPICKAEWNVFSNQLISLKDQLHAEWDCFEEHMAGCEGSDVDKDQQLLDSMKMKFRLKEEELKAATDKHHKAVRSCLEMEKRATSAEGERDGVLAKLKVVQIEKNESGEKYISVCKEKDEIEADLKKMLIDNNNLSVVLNHCKQMLLDKGFEIDEVEAISQELEESDATFKEIVSRHFSPVHEKVTSMQPKTEDKSVWRYDDIDKETLIQKDNEVQNKEFEEEYRSSKDSLGASMQTKEELQSTVSSLQEKLEQAEKSTLKESQEKASMLKELRQRIHDLESSFEKERSGAAAKVAILENMLHGMKQRVSRDHGLWWKVKQEVTRSLGKQWSLLAQACNINREDIKEIMNLYPDDLPEQISQMFYLIEERKDYSTVCSLMMCLRKAAMNSTHANQLHFRNLAESVFVIAVTYVCDGSFHIRWETFAKSVGAPSDMIEECLLDGTSSKKAQSVTFLQRWCQKNEWESLQRLVLGFEKMGDFNAANCAAWDMFGMSLADFKIVIQPHPVASGIQARFPIGNVVKFQSSGVHYRGTLKWAGFLPGVSSEMAGIELDSICYTLEGQTCNGTYHGQPYFTCDDGMGVFIPLEDVEYDWSLTTTGKVMEKLFTMPLKDQPPSVAMMEGWTWDEHRYPATTVNHMAQNIKQIESHTDTCIRIHGCLGTSDVLVEIYGTQKQKRNAASMISSLISSLGLQRLQPKHSGTFWPTAQQLMPHIYYMAIQAIRRNIGDKWPDLARGLGFDETDIDAIRVGPDRDNLHGQIFKMIRQWEQGQERGRGSVYGLLQGLRVAVSNTRAPNLKEIRDRIFTDILKVYILKDPDICGCWHKIAGVVGFSSDVKRECTLTDPTDRRKQAEEFLRRWCARDGWKVVDNLPMTLEKAGFEKAAAKVQDGVFGSVASTFCKGQLV